MGTIRMQLGIGLATLEIVRLVMVCSIGILVMGFSAAKRLCVFSGIIFTLFGGSQRNVTKHNKSKNFITGRGGDFPALAWNNFVPADCVY